MIKTKRFEELIAEMRLVGEQLIPYNYPNADRALENEMALVKTKETVIDGYSIVLHYSKNDFRTHMTETLQIFGQYVPFLPFNLVVKIARKFLGNHNLSEIEILRENQKMYCWTCVVNKDGKAIESPYTQGAKSLKHEDFEYFYLEPSQYNLY